MPALTLPRLVAGRTLAAGWIHQLGPITGQRVVVNARPLVSGSTSFAAELVRSALVDGQAAELVLVGGPQEFLTDVKVAADDLDVSARLRFALDDPELRPTFAEPRA